MSRFTKIQVCQTVIDTVMVPVFYHKDVETAKQVVKACYDGGVRAFEFTNRGDFAHEVFAELNKWTAVHCPEMVMGVGSVVEPGTASLYMQLGASFIVGPLFNADVAKACNRRSIPYIPGCATVTEIGWAQESGADIVKIFPAGNVGGPSFVKNVKAPMPWLNLMVTGGVEPTEENLTNWVHAGVAAIGMGSKLFPKDVVASGNWQYITDKCREAMGYIAAAKKK